MNQQIKIFFSKYLKKLNGDQELSRGLLRDSKSSKGTSQVKETFIILKHTFSGYNSEVYLKTWQTSGQKPLSVFTKHFFPLYSIGYALDYWQSSVWGTSDLPQWNFANK